MQRKQGHEVFVLTLTLGDSNEPNLRRFPFKLPNNLLWHPRGQQICEAQLKEIKPDVVHLHFGAASPFAWDGLKAVCNLDIASVATVHSIWGKLARKLYGLSSKSWKTKTVFSAVSEVAANYVSNTLGREVLVAHNGVDIEFWQQASQNESQKVEIVSATRFASRKRIRPQIDVIEKVVQQLGEASPHFTIAGSGPDFEIIKKRIKKAGLEKHVSLTGRLSKIELRDLYSQADLFLQMSVLEAFGIAACEARAAGLPVVTRQGSGVAEFVTHGETGFLENSDVEISNRIVELVKNRDELSKLKSNSLSQIPPQNWEYVTSKVFELYQKARNASESK
jgi:glycosyltransferase involved in cell wall biosynthesis